jgi:hypothetical protein
MPFVIRKYYNMHKRFTVKNRWTFDHSTVHFMIRRKLKIVSIFTWRLLDPHVIQRRLPIWFTWCGSHFNITSYFFSLFMLAVYTFACILCRLHDESFTEYVSNSTFVLSQNAIKRRSFHFRPCRYAVLSIKKYPRRGGSGMWRRRGLGGTACEMGHFARAWPLLREKSVKTGRKWHSVSKVNNHLTHLHAFIGTFFTFYISLRSILIDC